MSTLKEAETRRDSSFAKTCGYSIITDTSDEILSSIFKKRTEFYAGNIVEDYHVTCLVKIVVQRNDTHDTALCISENDDPCPLMYLPPDKIPNNLITEIQRSNWLEKLGRRKSTKTQNLFEIIKKLLSL